MLHNTLCLLFILLMSADVFGGNCEILNTKNNAKDVAEIQRHLSSKTHSNTIKIREIVKSDLWFIVEYESNDFEPVISVIKNENGRYVDKSDWGGVVVEELEGETINVISNYFKQNVPNIPLTLLRCYVPQGPPFVK